MLLVGIEGEAVEDVHLRNAGCAFRASWGRAESTQDFACRSAPVTPHKSCRSAHQVGIGCGAAGFRSHGFVVPFIGIPAILHVYGGGGSKVVSGFNEHLASEGAVEAGTSMCPGSAM